MTELNLTGLGKPAEDWYRIEAKADAPDVTEVKLYGPIGGGWWSDRNVQATKFRDDIAAIKTGTIEVHIASEGGSVYEGLAIVNILRQHSARIVAVVDSMAASTASFIAVSADELIMSPNSELMIHLPRAYASGTAAEIRKGADRLDAVAANMAEIYRAKAGGKSADWLALMETETWYSAQEAVDAKLADRVETVTRAAGTEVVEQEDTEEDVPDDDEFFGRTGLAEIAAAAGWAYAGRSEAPAPVAVAKVQTDESAPGPVSKKEDGMDLTEEIRALLGMAQDAEVTEEALATLAEWRDKAKASAAAGTVAVDSATLDQLRADAAAGRAARDAQIVAARESLVDAAIADGRIPPARRGHWIDALAADHDGMAAALNAMPKGLIPVGEPIGYENDGSVNAAAEADAYPADWK